MTVLSSWIVAEEGASRLPVLLLGEGDADGSRQARPDTSLMASEEVPMPLPLGEESADGQVVPAAWTTCPSRTRPVKWVHFKLECSDPRTASPESIIMALTQLEYHSRQVQHASSRRGFVFDDGKTEKLVGLGVQLDGFSSEV
jgi:hypothetical protein